MILSCVSLKGGSGKTTVAVNLSVEYALRGRRVMLVDADRNNRNSERWCFYRGDRTPRVECMPLPTVEELREGVGLLLASGDYDDIIIDGTPALADQTISVMMLSDLVLLPIQQSPWDVWAFNDQFLPVYRQLEREGDVDCRLLHNGVVPRTRISRAAKSSMSAFGIPAMRTKLTRRTVYAEAPSRGMGVSEYRDGTARWEISSLADECDQIFNSRGVKSGRKEVVAS